MKKSMMIADDLVCIEAGSYAEAVFNRVLLPDTIKEIQDGAFSDQCKTSFWVVKGSYAAYRIGQICPNAKVILFDSLDAMKESWEEFYSLKEQWSEVRAALPEAAILELMQLSGWTYEEAMSRAEKAYLKYGVTAKEYAVCEWKYWYADDQTRDPSGTWIEWRKNEIDKLERSLEGEKLEYDFDTSMTVPIRMSARKYAAYKTLGDEIRNQSITLKSLCDFLDVDVPKNLKDKKNNPINRVSYFFNRVSKGDAIFLWRKREAKPEALKRAGVSFVFGHKKFKNDFDEAGIDFIPCSNMKAHMFELAELWGRQFPEVRTVSITGSIGKTTTTEMINHVALSSYKTNCIWINKNMPEQGAWFTELNDKDTGVYVQEASGSQVGQQDKFGRFMEQDVFVITNVGTGHIGKHGGFRMSLLYEKTGADRRAKPDALGVVNYDDPLLRKVQFRHQIAWFSISDPEADFHAENIKEDNGILSFDAVEKDGTRTPIALHAIGLHNIYDALAAFITGIRLGIERSVIAGALGGYRAQGVRQNLVEAAGRRFFLDCYSATLDSVVSALATCNSFTVKEGGKKICVLCDIPDLGHKSEEIHLEIGRLVREADSVDQVIFYGYLVAETAKVAQGGKAEICYTNSRKQLEEWLSQTSKEDVVIFKSSHKMELHRVADDILGTTFNMDDLRVKIEKYPVVEGIKYTNVPDYGACATSIRKISDKLHTVSEADGMPVRMIAAKAFEGSGIEEAVFDAPLISIGKDAFSGCRSLKKISLPASLYYLGVGAFRDCSDLEEVEIPAGCATLDSSAFAGCTGLKRVKLPASIETFGEAVFDSSSTAVFECVRDSLAAEAIGRMCPDAEIRFIEPEAEDVCKAMPDMSVFVENDRVYTAENNIHSLFKAFPEAEKEEDEDKETEAEKKAKAKAMAKLAAMNKTSVTEETNAAQKSEILSLSEIPQGAKVQTVTITATGDNTFGKNHLMKEKDSWGKVFEKKGPEYFFSEVAAVFKASDIAIGNLEGVLTDNPERQIDFYRERSSRIDPKKYCHLGESRYLEAFIQGGINVATFANNHNMDYGISGYIDTIETCRRYNLPVAHYDHVVRKQVGDILVGIVAVDFSYCSNKVGEGILMKAMADVRRDCNLIVVCVHWGANYKEKAGKNQRRIGHLCIDLGADMVIGNHAHILQGIERYKGRYIYYSLGNFCYGGRPVPKDNDTAIVEQTFTFADGRLVVNDDVRVIPCWMSGKASINDFRPVLKDGPEGQAVISKINTRSADYNMRFDQDGRPVIDQATDARTEVKAMVYDAEVPDIIYTLTDV